MPQKHNARSYDELEELKEKQNQSVNKDNALEVLKEAKENLMKQLQTLDITNITSVENLYLTAAQLTQAAAYVAAINKATTKNTSFDEEINSIGTDEVSTILFDALKDQAQINLRKINLIDDKYKPAKQSWANLHSKLDVVVTSIKLDKIQSSLKTTIPAYQSHIENKLKQYGVTIPPPKEMPENTPPILKKMLTRYQNISDLAATLASKKTLNHSDIKLATNKIITCLNNKPDWSERPFLQKLTDVLSLGIKPLYRAFFSKEKTLQKDMLQTIETTECAKDQTQRKL